MVFYLPFVLWVPICKYKWPGVFVLFMLKEDEGCKEENLETKTHQDCHCSCSLCVGHPGWFMFPLCPRELHKKGWQAGQGHCLGHCLHCHLHRCTAVTCSAAHRAPHFWYPWNPHSPSGRFLGAMQCPGQLPAGQEMRKCPHPLSGLLEKQEHQVSVLAEGTLRGSDYQGVAIRVFWLPAHGSLALSPSEIPSLGRIHGPAVS